MARYDLLLHGGRVVDPAAGVEAAGAAGLPYQVVDLAGSKLYAPAPAG